MKTIHKVIKINNNRGNIQEIVEFNGKKFKIVSELRNGGNVLKAEIMDSDGVFQFVLGNLDVDFKYKPINENYLEFVKNMMNKKDLNLIKDPRKW